MAIRVEGLGKRYRLGGRREPHRTLREAIMDLAKLSAYLKRRGSSQGETVWALENVNLEVHHGEVIGIIGRNGAGKSTLLKILARITAPTTGRVELTGRVGSLLEVGTGFHPELTGRENIFLNGAILGMHRSEIARRFDEIVAFAEVEKFLDTPVKRYSSGMYVRLAFAVAAHLETEILLIDEVLAVGDVLFQKKCLGKIGSLATEGRTVLFVSHNMTLINRFCETAVLLVDGRVRSTGPTAEVTSAYLEDRDAGASVVFSDELAGDRESWPFVLVSLEIIDERSNLRNRASRDERLFVRLTLQVRDPSAAITVGYSLFDSLGNHMYRTLQTDSGRDIACALTAGLNTLVSELPLSMLNEGAYFVVPDGSEHRKRWLYNPTSEQDHACKVEVVGPLSRSEYWQGRRAGLLAPCIEWLRVDE